MSSAFMRSPLDPYKEDWWTKVRPKLAKQIFNASQFLRGVSVQLRFGELSRAPLHLLRFQIEADTVECDWIARAPDPWDVDLKPSVRHRHTSLQTLKDAIDVRTLVFSLHPEVETAALRVFRESLSQSRELIIAGNAQRNDNSSRGIHSLTMRAKILGFRFNLDGDVLKRISSGEQNSHRD